MIETILYINTLCSILTLTFASACQGDGGINVKTHDKTHDYRASLVCELVCRFILAEFIS